MVTDQRSLRQAFEAFKAGRLNQVEKICRRVLRASSNHADALNLLGLVALKQGEFGKAAELGEKAHAAEPGRASFLINLGEAYRCLGRSDEAIATCKKALGIDSDVAEGHCGLANAYLDLGEFDDAIAAYDRAIALNPGLAEAHYNKGNAQSGAGIPDAAIASYRTAVGINPDFGDAHFNLGNALQAKGELVAATDTYREAARCLPGLAKVRFNLGEAYRKLGRLEDARRAFVEVIEIDTANAAAHVQIGTILKLQGRLNDARRYLESALALDPDIALAHAEHAHIRLLQGERDEAIAGYSRAVALDPNFAWGHMGLSGALAASEKFEEARAATARAVRLRRVYERAFLGRSPVGRVVVFKSAEDGYFTLGEGDTMALITGMNNVEEHFDRARLKVSSFYVDGIDHGTEAEALPGCDLIFNAISDPDAMPNGQRVAERLAESISVPILNRPAIVADSLRDVNARRLGAIDGLVFPRTLRIEGPPTSDTDLRSKLDEAGIALPALVRRIGTHVTHSLEKVDDLAQLATVLSTAPSGWFYVIEYVDYATEDGEYIKMRFHVIDGQFYPNQLWFSPSWMVKGGAALRPRMRENPWMMDAARHFLGAPRDYLGDDAYNAVLSIYDRLPLDYFGIDFSQLPDGRIIVFEANAAVRLAHRVANDFDFRVEPMNEIKRAVQRMIEDRLSAAAAC